MKSIQNAALRSPELRRQVSERLSRFDIIEQRAEHAAAVALVITELGYGADLPGLPRYRRWQTEPALLLTVRSARLKRHAGQWALPGGRLDRDESPEQAAMRETFEEISLSLAPSALLGRLDDIVTRSGFVVTPLVFWADRAGELQADPAEVASIHRVPLSELLRADAPMLDYDELTSDERLSAERQPVLRMPLGERWIAAPTAAILYQFREVCLLGKTTRVAHFEQPKFTWR